MVRLRKWQYVVYFGTLGLKGWTARSGTVGLTKGDG